MIDVDEYRARRAAVMARMQPDDILLLFAAHEKIRNRDVHYPFRQHSDFLYLTGFDEPDALLALVPGRSEGEFVMFVRSKDPTRELWDGFRHGEQGATRDFAADQAFTLESIDAQLPRLLSGRQRVLFGLGDDRDHDQRLLNSLNELRATSRSGTAIPDQIVGIGAIVHEQRLRKRPAEIEAMRFAATVSADAHCRAMQATRPGRFEYQIEAELNYRFGQDGMQPAYGSIVAGGANACVLHYIRNSDELHDGDLLLVDAAAENRGYCADITRTWPVNGRYSDAQRDVYDVVLEAQHCAIDAVRAGNDWNAPHEAAVRCLTDGMRSLKLLSGDLDELIEKQAYRRYYMHNTGHWLGMDVHDVGDYKRDGEWRALEPDMVLTVEPGLYIAADDERAPEALRGMGIRIEDDVRVTDADPEVLTAAVPKAPDAVEALMRS